MKNAHPALLSLVAIGTVTSALTLLFTVKNDQTTATIQGWDTYTSADGDFHFQKPNEVTVNCKQNTCTLTSPTDTNPQPVPDMTILVENGKVSFQTWENFEIPYFENLVSSFEFNR